MVDIIKKSTNIIEMLYAIEPLCYYFSMKPEEYWNSTYREITTFIKANLIKSTDNFKQEIRLQEEVTNKLIMADAMSTKRPRINSLLKTFKSLFPEKENNMQSAEEITRRMREIMNSDKKYFHS